MEIEIRRSLPVSPPVGETCECGSAAIPPRENLAPDGFVISHLVSGF
jgi:hypothetical protein